MLRFVWLLFFLHVSLFATDNAEVLKRADELTKSASKTEVFRAYNDYKNVYLRSVMDSDDTLKKKALQGIVITGKKLHIDIKKYQNELSDLKTKPHKTAATVAPQKTEPTNKSANALHKLKSASWEDGKIILNFNETLLSTDVNYFKLTDKKKKSYRYIFDIHAVRQKSTVLTHPNIKRIRVAQYRYDTMRLVLENDAALDIRFSRKDNRLIINPNVGNTTPATVRTDKKTLAFKDRVVVIDPGHGGKDVGALGYKKYREKIVVLDVAKMVAERLRKEGVTVYLTRNGDSFIKLRNRTKFANRKKADVFVSIHANSVPKKNANKAKGIETYFLSPSRSKRATNVAAVENSKEIEDMNYFGKNNFLNFLNREKIVASNKLAIDIQRGMLGKLQSQYKDIKDNGVREGPFWVLVGAQMPAVLVEVGFISHPHEARRMVNKSYQKVMAEGLAEGILRYFIHNP